MYDDEDKIMTRIMNTVVVVVCTECGAETKDRLKMDDQDCPKCGSLEIELK